MNKSWLEKRLADVEAALEAERKRADDAVAQAEAATKAAHDGWVNFVIHKDHIHYQSHSPRHR